MTKAVRSRTLRWKCGMLCFSILALAACTAERTSTTGEAPPSQPAAAVSVSDRPEDVYWGNFHVHTKLSFDSFTSGTTKFTPEQSYRFARGEEVTTTTGLKAKLKAPLDFLMVSDHAEFLGILAGAAEGDPLLKGNESVERWGGYATSRRLDLLVREFAGLIESSTKPDVPRSFTDGLWADMLRTADRYNEPGKFTTFSGYEWTSMKSGDNLHRVVVFKDDAETVIRQPPFSALDSTDPEQLWAFLSQYQTLTGGEALAIPHNGNMSEGAMFADLTMAGKPFDKAYLEARKRWEPVVEVTQTKGDGEAHPLLSPDDEFADFETWDTGDMGGNPRTFDTLSLKQQLQGEYARPALKKGLRYQAEHGANPYQFGMIGDSDTHVGLPTAREDYFFGKMPDTEPNPDRLKTRLGGSMWFNRVLAASGLTAIWSRANTRAELFAALKRKEVYASTGPRIRLRFFGGWDFSRDLLSGERYVDAGYDNGVPMGGVLPGRSGAGKAPRFMIVALKDPDAANLDRVQIIKGWRDASGKLNEKIFDVALSDGRKVDPKSGKAPPVGSTVDVAKATYTNSIGAVELRSFWTDPQFDPDEQAFYYVRVLEIPTPRWTTYDAARYGKPLPDDVPATIQERAYSSPIWYVAGD